MRGRKVGSSRRSSSDTSSRATACASRIIASDINDRRLALAKQMGADDTVHPDQVEAAVKKHTDALGVDVVLEMSGVPAAVHQAFALARVGGRVQMLGIPSKKI